MKKDDIKHKTTHIQGVHNVIGDDGRKYMLAGSRPNLKDMYTLTYLAYDENDHCYEVTVPETGYDTEPIKVVKHLSEEENCAECLYIAKSK